MHNANAAGSSQVAGGRCIRSDHPPNQKKKSLAAKSWGIDITAVHAGADDPHRPASMAAVGLTAPDTGEHPKYGGLCTARHGAASGS